MLYPAVEGTWAVAAWLVGRLVGRRRTCTTEWRSNGSGSILVVAPHPDDETLGAGGAIACHAAAGDDVTVAIVTDGRASRAGGLDPDATARVRAEEVRAAASALTVSRVVPLGLPEGEWVPGEAADRLRPRGSSTRPRSSTSIRSMQKSPASSAVWCGRIRSCGCTSWACR